jgi:hypothetical protein
MYRRKLLQSIAVLGLAAIFPLAAHAQMTTTTTTTTTQVDTVNTRDTIQPGEIIGQNNYPAVQAYLSPGNYLLVQRGMQMKIMPSSHLDWPPPYRIATEKYSPQCQLGADGELNGYVAGLPFPLLDPNDPNIATKIIWNYENRPMFSDDADIRYPEFDTYSPDGHTVNRLLAGHMAIYNNVGRIEVPPTPSDPDALASGVRSRFGLFPYLEPSTLNGSGFVRYRYINDERPDDIWAFNRDTRRVRRESESSQSDPIQASATLGSAGGARGGINGGGSPQPTLANNVDPDSLFGFSANPSEYTYRFLGEGRMLAAVHSHWSPERECADDASRVCPESWEMRHLYVIQADAKPGENLVIPRRVLYIDSEGWFITASDQYDPQGRLWKTLVNYVAYSDRSQPDSRVAVYPYRRFFPVAMVDKDLLNGYDTVAFMPSPTSSERDSWYINMGAVDNSFFNTGNLIVAFNEH